jgi:hypothetical protein
VRDLTINYGSAAKTGPLSMARRETKIDMAALFFAIPKKSWGRMVFG